MLCPSNDAPHPLPWGSAEFIGLGFLVFFSIIMIEKFGSPFMKNASVICGLLIGSIVAAACNYFDGSGIGDAPAATFLWFHRFPLSVDGRLILPLLATLVTIVTECIAVSCAKRCLTTQLTTGAWTGFDSDIRCQQRAGGRGPLQQSYRRWRLGRRCKLAGKPDLVSGARTKLNYIFVSWPHWGPSPLSPPLPKITESSRSPRWPAGKPGSPAASGC